MSDVKNRNCHRQVSALASCCSAMPTSPVWLGTSHSVAPSAERAWRLNILD